MFSLYATGNITGSLGQDYKQRRQAENAGELEPYTIRFSDGSTFSYRNLDPFATPIKIIVNALERYETLMYRREQGEQIDDTAYEQAFRMAALAVGSVQSHSLFVTLTWHQVLMQSSKRLKMLVTQKALTKSLS